MGLLLLIFFFLLKTQWHRDSSFSSTHRHHLRSSPGEASELGRWTTLETAPLHPSPASLPCACVCLLASSPVVRRDCQCYRRFSPMSLETAYHSPEQTGSQGASGSLYPSGRSCSRWVSCVQLSQRICPLLRAILEGSGRLWLSLCHIQGRWHRRICSSSEWWYGTSPGRPCPIFVAEE